MLRPVLVGMILSLSGVSNMKTTLFLLLLIPTFPCWALYECPAHDRVVLSSAPCDTTFSSYQREPKISSVLLTLGKNGSYNISGTVQGVQVFYVVDTGASLTSISARVAAAAGISNCIGFAIVNTANGAVRACRAVVSEIVFGSFRVSGVLVNVMPNMEFDVLLGNDVLRQFKISHHKGVMLISR